MDIVLRDRVGLLCDQLSRWTSLHTAIRDAGAHNELAELLAALAGTSEPQADHIEALLDAIDHACARVGLASLTSRTKALDVGLTLPDGLRGAQWPVGWTCPLSRCDRVVIRQEAIETPHCAANQNAPMAPYTLPAQ